MNDELARLFAPDDARDALRNLGGILIGLGLFMTFFRKSDPTLGRTWGKWGLFAVLMIAFAFLYGIGMLGRRVTAVTRPRASAYMVFGILLAPFVLFQFVTAVNGTAGASLNVFWIFLVTLGLGKAASLFGGVRYGLLLASLAAIVSWSALWNAVLSNGVAGHLGVYRGLLLILAALLVGSAFALWRADRAGWLRGLRAVGGDPELARSRANEIVTGGDADLVLLARELLREPYWALKAQQELGAEASWPVSYGYAVKRRAK